MVTHCCPICATAFNKLARLRRHIVAKHSGEKPFVCTVPLCGASYTRKDHLTRHECTHTGAAKWGCDYCSASFYEQSHWKRHTATHASSRGGADGSESDSSDGAVAARSPRKRKLKPKAAPPASFTASAALAVAPPSSVTAAAGGPFMSLQPPGAHHVVRNYATPAAGGAGVQSAAASSALPYLGPSLLPLTGARAKKRKTAAGVQGGVALQQQPPSPLSVAAPTPSDSGGEQLLYSIDDGRDEVHYDGGNDSSAAVLDSVYARNSEARRSFGGGGDDGGDDGGDGPTTVTHAGDGDSEVAEGEGGSYDGRGGVEGYTAADDGDDDDGMEGGGILLAASQTRAVARRPVIFYSAKSSVLRSATAARSSLTAAANVPASTQSMASNSSALAASSATAAGAAVFSSTSTVRAPLYPSAGESHTYASRGLSDTDRSAFPSLHPPHLLPHPSEKRGKRRPGQAPLRPSATASLLPGVREDDYGSGGVTDFFGVGRDDDDGDYDPLRSAIEPLVLVPAGASSSLTLASSSLQLDGGALIGSGSGRGVSSGEGGVFNTHSLSSAGVEGVGGAAVPGRGGAASSRAGSIFEGRDGGYRRRPAHSFALSVDGSGDIGVWGRGAAYLPSRGITPSSRVDADDGCDDDDGGDDDVDYDSERDADLFLFEDTVAPSLSTSAAPAASAGAALPAYTAGSSLSSAPRSVGEVGTIPSSSSSPGPATLLLGSIPGLQEALSHACPFPRCGHAFIRKPDWRAHVLRSAEHAGEGLACPRCSKPFGRRLKALEKHVFGCGVEAVALPPPAAARHALLQLGGVGGGDGWLSSHAAPAGSVLASSLGTLASGSGPSSSYATSCGDEDLPRHVPIFSAACNAPSSTAMASPVAAPTPFPISSSYLGVERGSLSSDTVGGGTDTGGLSAFLCLMLGVGPPQAIRAVATAATGTTASTAATGKRDPR